MNLYTKLREWHKGLSKGQTMTEYALILAAVAILVFVSYETMGQDITSMASWKVDDYLTSAN
jgi:Flp pilus assembly pilin Flp